MFEHVTILLSFVFAIALMHVLTGTAQRIRALQSHFLVTYALTG